jgi:glucose/arabinose dehydrogenase
MDAGLRCDDDARMTHLRASARPRRIAGVAGALVTLIATASPAFAAATAGDLPAPAAARVPAAAPADAQIALSLRASSLSRPVFLTGADDGTSRLFIVEQTGRIRILKGSTVLSTPFLSLAGSVSGGFEQGLLGLAFHPNYETNRKLYVNFTNKAGNTVIREYRASATNLNVVDTSTARRILKIDQPFANHNGGMLAFGRDGYLYMGMGDGGSSGDPGNRAQSINTLLGKMLRIDVNGRTATKAYRIPKSNPYVGRSGLNEIWQIGLRNPWRWSFDRSNGNLWIGDVGQGKWEEVDRATRTSSGPGRGINWGWRVLEGSHCYNPSTGCSTSGKTPPIAEYDHAAGRCSITGGYVYRGSAIPALVGGYVFGDYCSGEIWVIPATAAGPATPSLLLDTNLQISSFGENRNGELFVVDHGGRIYVIVQG